MKDISNIPIYVIDTLTTLENSNFKAYLVGGCTRDSLLGITPSDWDITTDALPEDIIRIFPHTIPTGIKHGTITVICPDKQSIEITTFRADGEYKDSRHPEEVYFSKDITDDLSRRDFTMNAIAWSLHEGLVDPFDGITDITNQIIRTVGAAKKRFSEDALRMMRAIRFSSILNFSLDSEIPAAISDLSDLLKNISIERIRDEFEKTLLSPQPQKILFFLNLGLSKYFFPELSKIAQIKSEATISILSDSCQCFPSRFAYLLSSCCLDSSPIMKRLKFDNKTSALTQSILRCLNEDFPVTPYLMRKALSNKMLSSGLYLSLKIRRDTSSSSEAKIKIDSALAIYNDILVGNHCTNLATLAVNGNDLDALGIKDGKEKGNMLNKLLDNVLLDPSLNTYDILIKIAKEIC